MDVAVQWGRMIWDQPSSLYGGGGPLGDGRDVINFFYNPSNITSDFNIANTSLQAAMLYQVPGDNGNLAAPLMQTISWELYFDRSFELLYGGTSSSQNDPGVIGVQADVLQLMQFTGMLATLSSSESAQVLGQPTTASGAAASAPAGTGIMMLIPA